MLKELRTQHRTIIQMVFSGYKNKEIAERLEMTDCTVSQIVRSPLGQAYLEGLQDKAQEATLDVRKKLVSMNKSALTVLERIMNPSEKAPHSVQLTAAKDVLDRTGYKAPDKLHVDMTMQTKTDQEIDAEINAMQQSINKTYLVDPNQSIDSAPVIEISPELQSPTELQSPPELQSSSEAFTDEQTIENQNLTEKQNLTDVSDLNQAINLAELSTIKNLDSSGHYVNSPQNKNLDNSPEDGNGTSYSHPEESEQHLMLKAELNKALINQIPADLFKNS